MAENNPSKAKTTLPLISEVNEIVANCDQLNVGSLIRVIRGQQVMLDRDLALLYGVETRRLNEQVKRNIERFPEDFMFQLTSNEFDNLMSQIATSSRGGVRKMQTFLFLSDGICWKIVVKG